MGKRMVPPHKPMRAAAHFTGMGLASVNMCLCKFSKAFCMAMASLALPEMAATHKSCMCLGATLAVTLTLPCHPHNISATAVPSSPEYKAKPSGASCINHWARSKLPVASLMPTMPSICDRRMTVSC